MLKNLIPKQLKILPGIIGENLKKITRILPEFPGLFHYFVNKAIII